MTKSDKIRGLLKKYAQDKCTPEEIGIIIDYFKEVGPASEVPSVQEINQLLKNAPKMEKRAADRIYQLIVSSSKKQLPNRKPRVKSNKIWKYVSIAASVIGITVGGVYYTNNHTQTIVIEIANTAVDQNAITLELGNNKIQIVDPSENKELYDMNGTIVGHQMKSRLVYDSGLESKELEYNVLKVPYGKRFNLILSDGSMIYLNAGTSVRFPIKFQKSGNREVFLSGEAFFDVTGNRERPFIVSTEDGMTVKVLGTSFNVRSYPEDENIETTLIKGKVRVMEQDLTKKVDLTPSQKAIYSKLEEDVTVEGVDPNRITSWKEGVLIYDETPMSQVIKDLERTYNVIFVVESNTILNYKYKGAFDNLDIDQVLKILELSSPLKYSRSNNKIILKEDTK